MPITRSYASLSFGSSWLISFGSIEGNLSVIYLGIFVKVSPRSFTTRFKTRSPVYLFLNMIFPPLTN